MIWIRSDLALSEPSTTLILNDSLQVKVTKSKLLSPKTLSLQLAIVQYYQSLTKSSKFASHKKQPANAFSSKNAYCIKSGREGECSELVELKVLLPFSDQNLSTLEKWQKQLSLFSKPPRQRSFSEK